MDPCRCQVGDPCACHTPASCKGGRGKRRLCMIRGSLDLTPSRTGCQCLDSAHTERISVHAPGGNARLHDLSTFSKICDSTLLRLDQRVVVLAHRFTCPCSTLQIQKELPRSFGRCIKIRSLLCTGNNQRPESDPERLALL